MDDPTIDSSQPTATGYGRLEDRVDTAKPIYRQRTGLSAYGSGGKQGAEVEHRAYARTVEDNMDDVLADEPDGEIGDLPEGGDLYGIVLEERFRYFDGETVCPNRRETDETAVQDDDRTDGLLMAHVMVYRHEGEDYIVHNDINYLGDGKEKLGGRDDRNYRFQEGMDALREKAVDAARDRGEPSSGFGLRDDRWTRHRLERAASSIRELTDKMVEDYI